MSGPSRIDDDQNENRIELIRQIQQQEQQLEQQQIESGATAEVHGELQQIEAAEADKRTGEKADGVDNETRLSQERHDEIQGQAEAQDLATAGTKQQVDGSHRATEAVDAAHKQQERGESWSEFQKSEPADVPPSVEATAQDNNHREDAQQEEDNRIKAGDIQNQMAVQNRMIKS